MSQKEGILHEGVISDISGDVLTVSIITQSACAGCHSKGACSMADQKNKDVQIIAGQKQYKVGDKVQIAGKEAQGFKALFFAYVLPLILLVIILVVFNVLAISDGVAAVAALSSVLCYYGILYTQKARFQKMITFSIVTNDSNHIN